MGYGNYWAGHPGQGGATWDSPARPDEQSIRDRRRAEAEAMQAKQAEQARLRDALSALGLGGRGRAPMGIDPHAPRGSEFSALGGRGKAGRGTPEGHYVQADFPGLDYQLWAMDAGFAPKGYRIDPRENSRMRRDRQGRQGEAADYQRKLLGRGGPAVDPLARYKQRRR